MSNIVSSTTLSVIEINPAELQPCPWNPNRLDPQDEVKLDNSILKLGMFKPILVRRLPDGAIEVVGGHYRRESAMRLGLPTVPVIDLGEVSDSRAKEIMVIDNGRYGHDDSVALAQLLEDLGKPSDLASFMPYDLAEMESFLASSHIDLDDLGLDDEEAPAIEKTAKTGRTHEVMRFKVGVGDAETVRQALTGIMGAQGFTESDELSNAGDALVWIISDWLKNQT